MSGANASSHMPMDLPSDGLLSHSGARTDGVQVHHETQTETPEPIQEFAQAYDLDQHLHVLKKAHMLMHGEVSLDQIPGITSEEILALRYEDQRRWRQPGMLYFTILICSLAALEQGWAQTSMNGANLYFPQAFGIDSDSRRDNFIVGLINSAIYLSTGIIGAWSSEYINNLSGRRGALTTGSLLCLLGNLGSSISLSWSQLLVFRFVLGFGLGLNASTASIYAAECAPATIRGGLAVSWQMWVAFGIFLGFVANAAVFHLGSDAWRLQLGAAFIPTIPLLMTIYFCPESPSWYIKTNDRYDLAYQSLRRLRNTDLQAARDLYSAYLQQITRTKLTGTTKTSFIRKIAELFTIPRVRRATTASYALMLSQQLCGINIIAFYSSTIFLQSGFSAFGALLASCVFGFVNFVGAFPAVWTMDTFGRRSLLLLTLPLMALTMFAAGLSFLIPSDSAARLITLASMIYLFCAEYSPGMGPVPAAYSAEAFPLSHREVGMSMGIATANIWAACLSLTFPRLLSAWGSGASFELYAGLNVVALILVFLFVPETRLKTLEELDEVFSVPTRVFIRYHSLEWLPWVTKKYLLGQRRMDLKPLSTSWSGEYRQLEQEEDDQL